LLANVNSGRLELLNENFDVGTPTVGGHYEGADLAYAKLLGKLADRKFSGVPVDLRSNIMDYYKDRKQPASPPTKKTGVASARLLEQRAGLEQLQTQTATAP